MSDLETNFIVSDSASAEVCQPLVTSPNDRKQSAYKLCGDV